MSMLAAQGGYDISIRSERQRVIVIERQHNVTDIEPPRLIVAQFGVPSKNFAKSVHENGSSADGWTKMPFLGSQQRLRLFDVFSERDLSYISVSVFWNRALTVYIRPSDSLVLNVTLAFSCMPKISGLSTPGRCAK